MPIEYYSNKNELNTLKMYINREHSSKPIDDSLCFELCFMHVMLSDSTVMNVIVK